MWRPAPGVQVSSIQRPGEPAQGETERSRRLVHLDMEAGTKQLLEADLVLWTAGSKPVSSPENKLKVPSCAVLWTQHLEL